MRFLVDECAGAGVARSLRDAGHDAVFVYEVMRGATDDQVLQRARHEGRILVTADRDFGEHVHREGRAHRGIVLLRLKDQRTPVKVEVLDRLIQGFANQLPGAFVVATESRVRFARPRL